MPGAHIFIDWLIYNVYKKTCFSREQVKINLETIKMRLYWAYWMSNECANMWPLPKLTFHFQHLGNWQPSKKWVRREAKTSIKRSHLSKLESSDPPLLRRHQDEEHYQLQSISLERDSQHLLKMIFDCFCKLVTKWVNYKIAKVTDLF